MIIDFHTHIFPGNICRNREQYFSGENAFKLLYDSPKSRLVEADALIACMEESRVDKSVVFGFPWRNPDTFKAHNDYILEMVARYPQRLIGFACLDVGSPGAAAEAARCLEAGLSGIGELAFYESGIDAAALQKLEPVMELCRERRVPVLIHTNEPVGHLYPGKTPNTLFQIYQLALRFPENRIVLAHWGGGIFFFELLKKEVSEVLRNVWFDTAASPFLYKPDIYSIAGKTVGFDKILWGTDFPLLKPQRYFTDMETAGLTVETVGRICGENAAHVLRL